MDTNKQNVNNSVEQQRIPPCEIFSLNRSDIIKPTPNSDRPIDNSDMMRLRGNSCFALRDE